MSAPEGALSVVGGKARGGNGRRAETAPANTTDDRRRRRACGDRRQRILDVAREVFLAEGYAAASMSVIAARVGGSKGTLYNYFPSKASLFAALVERECGPEGWVGSILACDHSDAEAVLTAIGARFLEFVLAPRTDAIHRMVITECRRFPELGRAFYEKGPRRGVNAVAAWMAFQIGAGRLRPGEPEHMAFVFLELCKAGVHHKRLWNLEAAPTAAQKQANTAEAVRVFLAAYGPVCGGPGGPILGAKSNPECERDQTSRRRSRARAPAPVVRPARP